MISKCQPAKHLGLSRRAAEGGIMDIRGETRAVFVSIPWGGIQISGVMFSC